MIFQKHIFVCTNERSPNRSKKSCGEKGFSIRAELVEECRRRGLSNKVRINKSGCLGVCQFGPAIVIYPAAIWYKCVSKEDVAEIVKDSIIEDKIVSRLLLKRSDLLIDRS